MGGQRPNPSWGFFLLLLGFSAIIICNGYQAPSTADEDDNYGTVVGIDLGDSYSRVAFYDKGALKILHPEQGGKYIPSYVTFTDKGPMVGDDLPPDSVHSANTVALTKELLGRKWSDPVVQSLIKDMPYDIRKEGDSFMIHVDGSYYTMEKIAGFIISKLRVIAEEQIGERIRHIVMGCPPHFTDDQRQALKRAAEYAGLRAIRVVNEDIAAAIGYGLETSTAERNIIVFDLGGDSLTVSLLNVDYGVFENLATRSVAIGGRDFNLRALDYLIRGFRRKSGVDVSHDQAAIQKLSQEVEKAKRVISKSMATRIDIESLYQGIDFSNTLTRSKFEDLNKDLFEQLTEPINKIMKDQKLGIEDIDDIILSGGSSNIPKVVRLVEEFFGGKMTLKGLADEAVVTGLATQARVIAEDDGVEVQYIMDVQPISIGIETTGGMMQKLVWRNTPIPTRKTQRFSTTWDNQTNIHVRVFAGERALVKDNLHLGAFELDQIVPNSWGHPEIDISIEIDPNWNIKVVANDTATGRSNELEIGERTFGWGPDTSYEQWDAMLLDADKHAITDLDIRQRQVAEEDLRSYTVALVKWAQSGGKSDQKSQSRMKVVDALERTQSWLKLKPENTGTDEYSEQKTALHRIVHPIVGDIPYTATPRIPGSTDGQSPKHDEL